jgi:hypothetical protein
VEQIAENMNIGAIGGAEYRKIKTGVISGAEHRKHENWWSPVFMFSVFCSTDVISFHVFSTLFH